MTVEAARALRIGACRRGPLRGTACAAGRHLRLHPRVLVDWGRQRRTCRIGEATPGSGDAMPYSGVSRAEPDVRGSSHLDVPIWASRPDWAGSSERRAPREPRWILRVALLISIAATLSFVSATAVGPIARLDRELARLGPAPAGPALVSPDGLLNATRVWLDGATPAASPAPPR